MTTPPGYTGNQTDTEGVSGNTGAAPRGTQDRAANTETATPAGYGGDPDTGLAPLAGTSQTGTPDTSGTGGGSGAAWVPTSTLLSGTPDTQAPGWPTTPGVNPVYRIPTQGVGYLSAAGAADTTRTDTPISDGTVRPDLNQNLTGTLESAQIGATGPTSALVPVAPAGTPAVVTGPRQVTVTWAGVADPHATAPVLGYVILGSTGGTVFVGDNQLSAVVTNLDPGQTYQFRVAARNKNGVGPYGTLSAAIRAYNPDAADAIKPGGLDSYSAQNPIYKPDGTVLTGSGVLGTPGAPTSPVLAGAGATNLSCTWVAPAGGKVKSYTVTLSTGQSKSVSSATLTTTFTGLTPTTATTFRVTAVGTVGSTQSVVSNSVNVP